jgi:hypothetical protein
MGITHLSGLEVAGVPTMGVGGILPFTGNWYFVDYYRGSDGNPGTADSPLQTLYQAQNLMQDGHNDVALIVPAPLTTSLSNGTQRLSLANALAINPAAASGSLLWAKNACHIIGLTAPCQTFQRARLAPPSGTYTAATFLNSAAAATNPLVYVTAHGCVFYNFTVFGGFSTGSTSFITWLDAGGENYYRSVAFQGQADAASAAGTGTASTSSRTLLISGTSGDNVFERCTIGTDTVQRVTNATQTMELAGGTPRNKFIECDFPLWLATAAAGTNTVYTAGSTSIDRFTKFDRCAFLNASTFSSGVAQTGVVKIGASAGGQMLFKDCSFLGATGTFASGDTTTSGQMWVDGGGPISNATASSTGIPIHPFV